MDHADGNWATIMKTWPPAWQLRHHCALLLCGCFANLIRCFSVWQAHRADKIDTGIQGACGTCASSTATMKMGIERALKVLPPPIPSQAHFMFST